MAKELNTHIHINASPQEVWNVLSDLDSWQEWNYADPGMDGELTEGNTVTLIPANRKGKPAGKVKVTLEKVEPSRELRWSARWPAGLFHVVHTFRIESRDSGSTVYNEATFRGVLVTLMPFMTPTEDMYNETNRRLKAQVGAG